MITKFIALMRDQRGTGMLEYVLIVAFLALAIFASLQELGDASDMTFTTIANKFRQANDLM